MSSTRSNDDRASREVCVEAASLADENATTVKQEITSGFVKMVGDLQEDVVNV